VLNINLKLELKTTLNLHRTSRVVLSHVLPLVTPRLRSRPPPKYLRTAVAAICGGPSWSSPGKLHPFRPSSLSSYYKREKRQDRNSITRTQKVVRPDISGTNTSGKTKEEETKLSLSSDREGRPEMKVFPSWRGGCGGVLRLSGDRALVIRERRNCRTARPQLLFLSLQVSRRSCSKKISP
jgi:hypothetical protein